MSQAAFLRSHQGGIAELFGIGFVAARRDRVAAALRLAPGQQTAAGAVPNAMLTALADCAASYGAALNLAPGECSSTLDARIDFLRPGEGDLVEAIASPLRIGPGISVWRVVIRRGAGTPIAEATQTQLAQAEIAQTQPGLPTGPAAVVPEAAAAGPPAGDVITERRRQIFEGASRVIAEKGFANATIREIAAASGMPVPTMYQYIERKEDLLFFIYEFFMQDYTGSLRHAIAGAGTRAEKLAAAIRATLDHFDDRREYIKLMFQETRALSPEGRQRVYELDAHFIAVWTALLADLARHDGAATAEPELLANFIYFLCAIWPLRYWTVGKFGRAAVEAALAGFIGGGLGLNGAPIHREIIHA